ncbi:MAG: RluA family pseudouridine synthase [Butyrivibrio sp.]|nr:RluA family pseudouridine synthase [Butyrivibrio sp.]
MSEYRELTYPVKEADGKLTAGDIMRDLLHLSSREVSRCKQFEDGVMAKRSPKIAFPDTEQCDKTGAYEAVRLIDELAPGDTLIVRIYEDNDNAGDIVPTYGPIDIVYEDEDLIVLNKEGDVVIHPSYAHYTDSLSNLLAGYYEKTGQKHVIRTIGRLDRETSGLVIFAKNRHSAALLSKQTENMSRRKEYLAICSGVFDKKEGMVDAPIRRRPDERMIREVHPEGKRAVTHFKVEQQYEDYALVRLILDTGRTHQIRVHMSHIGHPLLGDNFYGKEIADNHGLTRAALHAVRLEFQQPITCDTINVEAQLPSDMQKLL